MENKNNRIDHRDESPLSNNPAKIRMNKIMHLQVKYGEVIALRLDDSIVTRGEKSCQ